MHLVQAATALHWFDFPKFYAEVDRVLVPGGVVAGCSCCERMDVVDHPQAELLSSMIHEVGEVTWTP